MVDHSSAEIVRWLQAIEKRMGEMHGENKAGIAEVKTSVASLAELQRTQNGNVAKLQERTSLLEMRAGVIESQQRTMDGELDAVQAAATKAATGAASQAILDTAVSQKRQSAMTALSTGLTAGAIMGGAYAIEIVGKWLMTLLQHIKP